MTDESTSLVDRAEGGDRLALSRAITAIEDGTLMGRELGRLMRPRPRHAQVVGLTGPPGAGKSTLVAASLALLEDRGDKVAGLLIDPSSPASGGAVLGDRVRIARGQRSTAFIRSMASRGHLGGLARNTALVVNLLDLAGYDLVLIETVGAGQSEIEVSRLADCTIGVFPPGMGDDIQAIKAGILEVCDIIVVNKADDERAARALADFHAAGLDVSRALLSTVATTGQGVDELWAEVDRVVKARDRSQPSDDRLRMALAAEASTAISRWIATDPSIDDLCQEVLDGRLGFGAAALEAASLAAVALAPSR